MRNAVVCLLFAALVAAPVHAGSDRLKFEDVQERCIAVGKVKFGANAKWQDCQLTDGRWFATLDIMDQYQTQYCLGKGDGVCAQRAFTVFANRAYTPDAKMLVQRIDPGNAEYDEPLIREGDGGMPWHWYSVAKILLDGND